MYKLALRITKNKKLATLASIIYILAPYRITDMYIRTALAELASFIFIPIVFEGLYIIVNEEKKAMRLGILERRRPGKVAASGRCVARTR